MRPPAFPVLTRPVLSRPVLIRPVLSRRRLLAALAVSTALQACTPGGGRAGKGAAELQDTLAGLLAAGCEGWTGPGGVMLHVSAPRIGLDWSGATSCHGPAEAAELDTSQPLRIASITKTFVAASTLKLVQHGKLSLETSLAASVSDATAAALAKGGYDPEAITLRMLLQHTSGLYDYAEDDAYLARVMADPSQRWTRASQLAFALDHGQPYGAPGAVFHYSDTGYILLGEILERRESAPLAAIVRASIGFGHLGLNSTWWERDEPVPAGLPPRAPQYIGETDILAIDPSVDLYGGGGLVSTLPDLARFLRALFQTDDILGAGHRGLMMEPSAQSLVADSPYGMGLARMNVAGEPCFGHGGYWGTVAWHCPARDVTVAAAVTNTNGRDALRTLRDSALADSLAAVPA